jgi:hypothetical protein
MTKKSEDIILLCTNQSPELDKYHVSRIRAQTASMELGLVDNQIDLADLSENMPSWGWPGLPIQTDHEIRRIAQTMFFCHLIATGMVD